MATKKTVSKSNGEAEVVVVEAPKPTTIEEITAAAWNAIKGEDDAPFALCQPNFQGDLLYHAQAVRKSQETMQTDTSLARFEREVKRLVDQIGG